LVEIYLTKFEEPLSQPVWDFYSKRLPLELLDRVNKFYHWQDRHSCLFGKLLLLEGLKNLEIKHDILKNLQYNAFRRPSIPNIGLDFNISHSGKYVVCAIGNLQIGIDIEENKETSLEDFEKIMTPKQWNIIRNSPQPYKAFYRFWTIKESVIKADGRGLSIPLDELEIEDNTVNYDGKLWNTAELNIDNKYNAALASNKSCAFNLHKIDFYENLQI
jgi:4'-phosphopantetheinyl transferase